MVYSMTWAVKCPESGAPGLEHLAIFDIKLPFVWLVLEESGFGGYAQDILDATDMVVVPMGQDGLFDRGLLFRQYLLERLQPGWFALPGIDQ